MKGQAMLTYEQIYSDEKKLTIKRLKALVAEHCPHIKMTWNSDVKEFRITYKGLKPEREEAMAAYVPAYDWNDKEGYQDALGTAITMERYYALDEFKPKYIQGLYSFLHYEREDGAWYQVSIDNKRPEVTFLPHEGAKFRKYKNLEELREALIKAKD